MTELNKAEKYLIENLTRLANEGCMDDNPRGRYASDNSPSHSISIRGSIFETYNLQNNEFPITETRRIAVKGAINEILAIYQTQTNTNEGFKYHGVSWWDSWMNEYGNIGRAYSYNLESHRPGEMKREVVKIKKRLVDKKEKSKMFDSELLYPIEDVYNNSLPSLYLGKVINGKYGDFKILSKTDSDRFLVQFLATGYKKYCASKQIRERNVKSPYSRTVCNFGYLGEFEKVKGFSDNEINELKRKWTQMIERCHSLNEKLSNWSLDMICTEWHSFEGFLRTVKSIPQYFIARDNGFKGYVLDKDYFSSGFYSPETSAFITDLDNVLYNNKAFIDNKTSKIYISQKECANDHGLNSATYISDLLISKRNDSKYDFSYIEDEDEYIYRYELSRNQMNELLHNLKHDPYSKRHLVSFYNWANMDKKMLVECAYETLWTVSNVNGDKFLDLTLVQRSSDALVAGTGINQMQYVALQMMVAKHLGIKVGLFEHLRKNWHVYDRHTEQVEETIKRVEELKSREVQSQPKLILNVPDGTNFYDISEKDFELIGYNPILPQLKFDLAV